jgi:hypothetical protein
MGNIPERKTGGSEEISVSLASVILARLSAIEAGQSTMNGALGLMLDTLQAQTNLLRRLHEFAKDEPADSPASKILQELLGAIMDLDASVGGIDKKFESLTSTLLAVFGAEDVIRTSSPVNGGN